MSMAFPAWIMTRLSIKPKPTMGIADRRATIRNCRGVGFGTKSDDEKEVDGASFSD